MAFWFFFAADTVTYFKVSAKEVERDGEVYYDVDQFKIRSNIGAASVRLVAENPQNQFGGKFTFLSTITVKKIYFLSPIADLISSYINENNRDVLDAMGPIYIEAATKFYKKLLRDALSSIPARELHPTAAKKA